MLFRSLEYAVNITKEKNSEAELAKYHENLETMVKERTEKLKTALEQNRYQLVRLDLLVEALGIGLWDMQIVNGDPYNPNNTVNWSDEFWQLLGYTDKTDFPNTMNGWSDRLHPDDKERTLDVFIRHVLDRTGKTPYDIEYKLLKKNGEYAHFKAFGATVRDKEGYPLRVAGAILEIKEEKT